MNRNIWKFLLALLLLLILASISYYYVQKRDKTGSNIQDQAVCMDDPFGVDTVSPLSNTAFSYTPQDFECTDVNGCVAVPIPIMVETWEYSCVQHIQNCDYEKAQNVLDTMNWACGDRKEHVIESSQISQGEAYLEEARNAKTEALENGTPFVCDSIYLEQRSTAYLDCLQ